VIRKILIANRGEIALRIARTCREMGIATVAVYSTADRDSPVVRYADESVHIGPAPPRRSYLYMPSIVEAALRCGADAVHPGYGFLSEDPDFAQVCAAHELVFIGPRPEVMEKAADKARVRALLARAGLPVLPGSDGPVGGAAEAEQIARAIGFPLVIKASAGGGGRGITVVERAADFVPALQQTSHEARMVFGNGEVYLERYLPAARHVEVQILADAHGNVVHLGERDCSLQRRNQKLVEESPSPGLDRALADRLGELAVTGARSLAYSGVGTMEFLVGPDGTATFMELNARIQVEHPVTEMVTGIDLIREQILVAAGEPLTFTQDDIRPSGVAIECRINAEDPEAGFRPAPGLLKAFRPPGGPFTRVDSGFHEGDQVPAFYDSLLAKLIVWAPDREQALARAQRALAEFVVDGPGVHTTIPVLRRLLAEPAFVQGRHTTRFVEGLLP